MEELAAEVVVKGYALIGYGAAAIGPGVGTVSYTHLTLPTICSV